MKADHFLNQHPVFRRKEFVDYLQASGTVNVNTIRESLAYHVKKQHITAITRGYYAVTSSLKSGSAMADDPMLIAGRVTEDAMVAFHSALSYHGLAYSLLNTHYYYSQRSVKPFKFNGIGYQRVCFPPGLLSHQRMVESALQDRQGLDIRVTSVERTLVDCLHRPHYAGGWEEIARAVEAVSLLDIDRVIHYALLLNNATVAATLGFLLEQHQAALAVTETHLQQLEKHIPKSKHYLDKERRPNGHYRLQSRWRLLVPEQLLSESWEEPHHDSF